MKLLHVSWLALVPAIAMAQMPSPERGRALYENHCQVCHTPKVHTRANRMAIDTAELRGIVNGWQRAENLRWSAEDIEDVVHFLRQTRYRF